ncbi:outer membrane protein [Mesorhizobium silamurunense]|uniref:outer membrane protein n=1 Tax=Mesorhizobium silamurunense TaxID=499528 RepID=UPI00177B6221|nr:outer membrane protein [Mesorhizobium silamurunense]
MVFSTVAAKAADLSPVVAAPTFNWTGLYVGIQGDYQWSNDRSTEFLMATGAPTGFFQDFHPTGGLGGIHVGYNYQIDRIVLGIEGDAELGRVSDSITAFGNRFDARKNWEASIRGRLGPMDRLLLYVTGGAAFTELKYSYVSLANAVPPANATISKTGWTVGGGGEVALTDWMTARLEYRYSDFGTTRFDWPPPVGGTYEQHPRFHELRAGISLKF